MDDISEKLKAFLDYVAVKVTVDAYCCSLRFNIPQKKQYVR